MAISIKKGTPIGFGNYNNCFQAGNGDKYCLLVNQDDETPIEVDLSPISGNLAPDFTSAVPWTTGSGWTVDTPNNRAVAIGASGNLSTTLTTLKEGEYYKVQFTLGSYVSGSVRVNLTGGSPSPAQTYVANGTYTFYLLASSVNQDFEVQTIANYTGDVSAVSVQLMSRPGFRILNNEDGTVLDTEFVTAAANFSQFLPIAKVSPDWSSYNQCVKLCLIDGGLNDVELVQNGDFPGAVSTGWNVQADWIITPGAAVLNNPNPSTDLLEQVILGAVPGYKYKLSFQVTVNSLSGSGLRVGYGIDSNPLTPLANINGLGNFEYEIDLTALSSLTTLKIFFDGGTIIQTGQANVTDVSLEIDAEELTCLHTSQCIAVSPSHDCTVVLGGTSTTNAFQYDFEEISFSPQVRVKGKRNAAGYPILQDQHLQSDGTLDQVSASWRKNYQLQIEPQPEYVLDFLSMAVLMETFTIDGVNYRMTGEFAPIYYRQSSLQGLILEVEEQTQDFRYDPC